MPDQFTVEMVLAGYMQGVFPMAERNGDIYWYAPDPRAIIPLGNYKPSKSLRPFINQRAFDIYINKDFEAVIRACSRTGRADDGIWISEDIIQVYMQLNRMGLAHSVEAWQDGKLAGGLYGVAIGGVFFGESMFHFVPNASKIAFHYLVERMNARGFGLLDTQFINDNVRRFGAIEIPREEFLELLERNIKKKVSFV